MPDLPSREQIANLRCTCQGAGDRLHKPTCPALALAVPVVVELMPAQRDIPPIYQSFYVKHRRLRVAMYRGLRRRGWTVRAALRYATHNPRSFDALAEAVATRAQQKGRA